jgi:hypothetical protein
MFAMWTKMRKGREIRRDCRWLELEWTPFKFWWKTSTKPGAQLGSQVARFWFPAQIDHYGDEDWEHLTRIRTSISPTSRWTGSEPSLAPADVIWFVRIAFNAIRVTH